MRLILLVGAAAAALLPDAALAQNGGTLTDRPDGVFSLGQIVVTAPRRDPVSIGLETLGQGAIERFNRNTLDEAANLIPGVTAGNSGGSRNERLLFVRGFDRFQVPLSIDGVRVYLPADNRLDYGRFLTPDIAEIQVAKGYPSVLDGPGALGGAVNLVTRRPTRPFEAEARGVMSLGRDGDYTGHTAFGLVGARRERGYAQASYARNLVDHWDLSDDFTPTVNEDGGERDFSRTEDWRVNAKIGFTPNATDEYALSYTRQEGEKNAPLHLTDTSNVSLRNWAWPYWNVDSLYFLSTTALGGKAVLKTRVYRNRLQNLLQSFDNRTQTTQALPRAFDSPYDDIAVGGSAQLTADLTSAAAFSIALHYRRDEHKESQTSRPDLATSVPEPVQTSVERTWSVAVENRLALSDALGLTLGASYDWRDLQSAEEFGVPPGATGAARLFSYPLRDADAFNGQGRLDWLAPGGATVHASVSSRTRFPTLFERFSSQFGTAEANPDLDPERATTYELGGDRAFGSVRASAAVFYSDLDDALVSVRTPANLNRRENLGSAEYYGGELALDADLTPSLRAGLNYSYMHRSFDVGAPPAGGLIRPFELTDVPDHKAFAWLSWSATDRLEITPSVEFASDRTTVTPASANGLAPVYYDTGEYALAGLRVDYEIRPGVALGAGGRNLFDEDYVLTDGFPEPGRSLFVSISAKY